MKLFYSANSPFVRKCRVMALEKGIELELVEINALAEPPELLAVNPLGKIPALLRDDGTTLCESPVICEYLDSLKNPALIPASGEARWNVLNLAALANGIMDAAVAMILESRRPEDKQWDGWMKRQEGKISRAIALAAKAPLDAVHLGTLSLAVALGYVSFRQPQIEWRKAHPNLAAWLNEIEKRESLSKTAPKA